MIWPSTLSLLSYHAGKNNQGATQGMAAMASSIAGVIGLFGGGYLFDQIGKNTFIISAIFAFANILVVLLYPKKENKTYTAGGVVINTDGDVLIVNQNNNSWSLPKGHIDKGEDARTAAEREIYEEAGIKKFEIYTRSGII